MKRRVFGFSFNKIQLAENGESGGSVDGWTELLREGSYKHPAFGVIPVTKALLLSLKENFDNNVRGIDVGTDYYHEWDKDASGWIEETDIRVDEQGKDSLFIRVDWTKKARQKLEDRELKYISADFSFNYEDNETGAKHGPTLLGAGLTNRPHIKRMQALLSESDDLSDEECKKFFPDYKGDEVMDFEDLLKAVKALTDDQKAQVGQALGFKPAGEKPAAAAEEKKPELSEAQKALQTENVALKEKIALGEKKSSFDAMLSEGTVVEAQRDHFMKDDMAAFAKASVEVNLGEDGKEGDPSKTGTAANKIVDAKTGKTVEMDKDGANAKLEELADEYMEKNKDLDYGAALSEVVSSNPELAKLAEA